MINKSIIKDILAWLCLRIWALVMLGIDILGMDISRWYNVGIVFYTGIGYNWGKDTIFLLYKRKLRGKVSFRYHFV